MANKKTDGEVIMAIVVATKTGALKKRSGIPENFIYE